MIGLALSLCPLLLPALLPQESSALTTDGSRIVVDEGHAFVELSSSAAEYVVDQSFSLVLRFGLEREFARTNLVQLFRKELDVPVQIQAQWLAGSESMKPSPSSAPPRAGLHRFALAGDLVSAQPREERIIEGKPFVVYEFVQRYQVSEPGLLRLSPLEMRYAFATQFKESFLNGRSPIDRSEAIVRSAPLELRIKPLALDNPPIGFSGAIGSFTLEGSLRPGDDALGRSFEWTLSIAGEGNQHEIEAPFSSQLGDFNLLGVLSPPSSKPGAPRVFVYDLEPRPAAPDFLPACSFIYFDVDRGDFHTLWTEALPIPGRGAGSGARELPGGMHEEQAREVEQQRNESDSRIVPMAVGGLLLVVLVLLGSRLRARGAAMAKDSASRAQAPDPQAARCPQAARRAFFAAESPEPADASLLLARYSQFLATCLQARTDELQAKGLRERLEQEGIPGALAARAEAALSALLAARYGRGESSQEGQAAAAIVEQLVAHWER